MASSLQRIVIFFAAILCVFEVRATNSMAYVDSVAAPDSIGHVMMRVASEEEGDEPYIKRYTPLAPNSAALARYGEYPVSHTTGIPQISIPIYEIKAAGVTIPVSLSYHAGGVRTDDIASVAGLGWSLDAGGVITRQIEGVADFSLNSPNDTLYYSDQRVSQLISTLDTNTIEHLLSSGRECYYDTQSDRYVFNFCGNSGVMRYSYKDKRFVTVNHNPIYIEHVPGGNNTAPYIDYNAGGFSILGTDGTEYIFDAQECVGPSNHEGHTDVNAWYLTRVITLANDTISFHYVPDTIFESGNFMDTATVGLVYSFEEDVSGAYYNEFINPCIDFVSYESEYVHRQMLLSEIAWKGNHVSFEYSEDRMDIAPSRLSRVSVINCDGDTLRSVSLSHTYFGNNVKNYRMMLSGLAFSDLGNFSFGYYNNSSFDYLPSYCTPHPESSSIYVSDYRKRDYWGYFNGKPGSSIPAELIRMAISTMDYQPWSDFMQNAALDQCADLTPDLDYARTGTLYSITYPGGGNTWFQYELNKELGEDVGGLRIREITSSAHDGSPMIEKTYSYTETGYKSHPREFMWSRGYRYFQHFNAHELVCYGYHTISSSPLVSRSEGGSQVFYGQVRETFADNTYIEYNYHQGLSRSVDYTAPDESTSWYVHPSVSEYALTDQGQSEPLIDSKNYYDNTGACIKSEEYTYTTVTGTEFSYGMTLATCLIGNLAPPATQNSMGEYRIPHLLHGDNIAIPQYHRLDSTVVTDHLTGMRTVTRYGYTDSHGNEYSRLSLQPSRVTVSNGDGQDVESVTTYVFERTDAVSRSMSRDFNANDIAVETRVYRGGRLASATSTEYAVLGSLAVPVGFVPCRISGAIGNGPMHEKVRLCDFDNHGNPGTVIENDCDTAHIVWDARGIYPLSIESGGLVSQYTHKPLFGVTSITEPSGISVCYEYGAGGRLRRVYDSRGTIAEYLYTPTSITTRNYIGSTKYTESVTWHDGLGRPVMQTAPTASAGGATVTMTQYDAMGREWRQWLPVAAAASDVNSSMPSTVSFMSLASGTYPGEGSPYSTLTYDALGRKSAVQRPGDIHAGHAATVMYGTKRGAASPTAYDTRAVRRYLAPVDSISMVKDGYWAVATLSSEKTVDEDGLAVERYTDKEGRTVLERRGGTDGQPIADTYYVYNLLGQLRYVLSPQYQLSGYKARFGYEYRYDNRGRIVKKILPDCETQRIWYSDNSSRPAYVTDGELSANGLYRYFIYDRAGRVTEQGTCRSTDGSYVGKDLEKRCWYDSYDFIDGLEDVSSLVRSGLLNSSAGLATPTGLPTGSEEVLSDGTKLYRVYYYDEHGRQSDTRVLYPGNRIVTTKVTYTYYDKPDVTSVTERNTLITERSFTNTSVYDSETGVPVGSTLSARSGAFSSSGTMTYMSMIYDPLGRVSTFGRCTQTAGHVDYSYCIDGALSTISAPGFTERLYYADGPGTARHNGFISAIEWTASDAVVRGYRFTYDHMGRLSYASYGEGEGLAVHRGRYDECVSEYSLNSMPRRLQRKGLKQDGHYGKIDNLHIRLDGNRIASVLDDAAPVLRTGAMDFDDGASSDDEYCYDRCGRLVRDDNRGIELIRYDRRGCPREICFAGGNRTRYVYTPDGEKIRTVHLTALAPVSVPLAEASSYSADSVDYRGPMVYHNGEFERFNMDGGYVTIASQTSFRLTLRVHYYSTDHLGNIRAVVDDEGTVEQVTHYYPFGGVITDLSSGQEAQPYKFGGKELDRVHGLNMYDYGARQYDPLLIGWDRMDPLCEKYYYLSPYCFCLCNPVRIIDTDGKDVYEIDDIGNVTLIMKTDDNFTFRFKDKTYEDGTPVKLVLPNSSTIDITSTECYTTTINDFENKIETSNKVTIFTIKGDGNAESLFEHMANYTSVEYSLVQTDKNEEKEDNFITTSHLRTAEGGIVYLYDEKLKDDYTIRRHVHNHPKGYPPNEVDKQIATQFKTKTNNPNIIFEVYTTKSGYTKY